MHLHPPATSTSASTDSPQNAVRTRSQRSVIHKRLVWTAVLALLIVLLVLTPPLINANRYRKRIADSMSASLGRPVHLDDASFHLLPVPGFTLRNLVVSEDPAFGAEPTVRANTVEATLRVSSLWHRPVEFSTVRFVNPSVNLVRNADGRWNLSDVLLHASHVESAPTDQRHAGPAPRFPYIEATSGRVNVKLGDRKLPFSLTEADFALWLPSSRQWRVRLVGHPARTDTDINDPGVVRLEGELRRADTAQAVPVRFVASWHDAPLGEASRILTGGDLGWRGSLNMDAALTGTLGDARLATKFTLGGLRRAEFFPAHPLDLQITCGSKFNLHPAALAGLQCTLPDDAPHPLALAADKVNLQQPGNSDATVQGSAIPMRWALLWASLFSSRVPTDLHPAGTVALDLVHGPHPAIAPATHRHGRLQSPAAATPAIASSLWTGSLHLTLPGPPPPGDAGTDASPAGEGNVLAWHVQTIAPNGTLTLNLPPTPVRLGPNASVTLAANVSASGYSLTVNGTAPPAAILMPARYLPQLGDGMEQVLPFPPTATDPGRVSFTCTRTWSAAQSCTGPQAVSSSRTAVPAAAPGQRRTPMQLAPRTLSPLDQAPFSMPRQ